jgi:hypothetical protein
LTGVSAYTHTVSEIKDVEPSIKHLLGQIRSESNALLHPADAKGSVGLGLKIGIAKLRGLFVELRNIREAWPAEAANLMHQNAVEAGEAYEAVTDVIDLVDPESKLELINLALDIRDLLK